MPRAAALATRPLSWPHALAEIVVAVLVIALAGAARTARARRVAGMAASRMPQPKSTKCVSRVESRSFLYTGSPPHCKHT